MKIFISWSGQPSGELAELIRVWLTKVLQEKVTPFVSSQDIPKGERGLSVIAEELAETDYGLAILTEHNINAPWILYEVGALSKAVGRARVSPLLFGLTPNDVEPPLGSFQSTSLVIRKDAEKLIAEINALLPDSIPDEALSVMFDKYWPDLETRMQEVLGSTTPPTTKRPVEGMVEEILETVRTLTRAAQPTTWGELGRPLLGSSFMRSSDFRRMSSADQTILRAQVIQDILGIPPSEFTGELPGGVALAAHQLVHEGNRLLGERLREEDVRADAEQSDTDELADRANEENADREGS